MAHPRRFRFGVQLAAPPWRRAWINKVRRAEHLGFSTIFMPDHTHPAAAASAPYRGGGRRMLALAARRADIVGVNPSLAPCEVNTDVGRNARASRYDTKLGRVRAAAAQRFAHLEINVLVSLVAVTDDRRGVAERLAPLFGLTPEEGLETLLALVGTIEQIWEDLEVRPQRWQISYYVVGEALMKACAPIVERMSGR